MAPFTKIHKNLVQAVVQTLLEIFVNQRYADKAIEYTLQSNKKWGSRDRAFIAENTYEIVRWWRLIREIGKVEEVNEESLWKIFGIWWAYNGNTLPEWEQFNSIKISELKEGFERAKLVRKINESIPDWMDEIGTAELGKQWDKELHALNIPAEVILRANTLKGTRDQLQRALMQEGIETRKNANRVRFIMIIILR